MRFSSLAAWLGWLEQSHPKEIDLGLQRIHQVANRLNLLKPDATVITVAGTNGKGSCVTATAALVHAAGFSVGVYTSPHLLHYAERIQINGQPVADQLICAAFELIADACANTVDGNPEISLTYFEYGTLAALIIFKQQGVDYVVLEVGLGGRLDAVNIIDADIAVITSIAIDHQDWLGDNREVIGREKAGILREQQIFICADESPPQTIVDIASQLQTQSYFLGHDFAFSVEQKNWQWSGKNRHSEAIKLPSICAPHLPLPSMAAALQVAHLLNLELSPAQIEAALLHINLAGRFQKVVYQHREFILDVAHNPAATAYFSQRVVADPVKGKTFAIVAMMADKDRLQSLQNLISIVDEWYLLELTDLPRAASVSALADNLSSLNTRVQGSGNMAALMAEILGKTTVNDRVLVFGSFFTVAAALAYLQADSQHSRGIV